MYFTFAFISTKLAQQSFENQFTITQQNKMLFMGQLCASINISGLFFRFAEIGYSKFTAPLVYR